MHLQGLSMCIDTDFVLPSGAKDTYQTFAYLTS